MKNRGLAHMGIGEGKGEKRYENAVRQAIASPLLETSINGAKAVIINVKGGFDLTLDEVSLAVNMVKDVVSPDANTIFGATVDEKYNDRMIVTIVATGFEGSSFGNATKSIQSGLSEQPQQRVGGEGGDFNNLMGGNLFAPGFGSNVQNNSSASDDMWGRLNSNSSQGISNYDEKTLDKKYGLEGRQLGYGDNFTQGNQQNSVQHLNSSSGLSTGIRVDDDDIPAFLRSKFNKRDDGRR